MRMDWPSLYANMCELFILLMMLFSMSIFMSTTYTIIKEVNTANTNISGNENDGIF